MTLKTTYYCEIGTPIGGLLLVGDESTLAAIHFQSGTSPMTVRPDWTPSAHPFVSLVRQLNEYFAGQRRHFDVSLEPTGTSFQRAVWQELSRISYGATTSYGEIARRIGHPLRSGSRCKSAAMSLGSIHRIIHIACPPRTERPR